jgi:hypothetical protein
MKVRHNVNGRVLSDILVTEIVATVNYAAGAISGAQIPPQSGIGPPQNVGIKSVMRLKSPPPSPEGGPPGVRTGNLRTSIGITLAQRAKGAKAIAVVGTPVKYAKFLEFKKGRGRRPFVQAGIDSADGAIRQRIAKMRVRLDRAFARRVRRLS